METCGWKNAGVPRASFLILSGNSISYVALRGDKNEHLRLSVSTESSMSHANFPPRKIFCRGNVLDRSVKAIYRRNSIFPSGAYSDRSDRIGLTQYLFSISLFLSLSLSLSLFLLSRRLFCRLDNKLLIVHKSAESRLGNRAMLVICRSVLPLNNAAISGEIRPGLRLALIGRLNVRDIN